MPEPPPSPKPPPPRRSIRAPRGHTCSPILPGPALQAPRPPAKAATTRTGRRVTSASRRAGCSRSQEAPR
eukprot:4528599-Prymnesium_polylepis.1